MHEYSVVQALIEQVQGYLTQHQACQIEKLVVQIGELSGVEPELFARAFETFKLAESGFEQAELVLQIQPVELNCQACGFNGPTQRYQYFCPTCQNDQVTITAGQDLLLLQIEMR
jgi:hydrogenase nickel incorporation protein HypA/HybF